MPAEGGRRSYRYSGAGTGGAYCAKAAPPLKGRLPPRRDGAAGRARLLAQRPIDVAEVQPLQPLAPIIEIAAQREFDARERNLIPGYVGLVIQADLQALGADTELAFQQGGTEI